MRVKVLRDFLTQELGDFTTGEIRNVPDWVARSWIEYGMVEKVENTPVLLQTKPEKQEYETKPEIFKHEVKKRGRNRKQV